MAKPKKPLEAVSGSFTPLPHALLDSVAFMGASDRAKALLLELIRQHNGRNNGQMQLSIGWLRKRGWTSASAIQLAKSELLERGLAILTKRGGLNAGPDRYAVTWLNISDYAGLDLKQGTFAPGAWRFADPPPVMSKRQPPPPESRTKKRKASSGSENSTVPVLGPVSAPTVPVVGTKTALFAVAAVPATGNNEVTSSLPADVCGHGTPGTPPRTLAASGWEFTERAISADEQRRCIVNIFRPRPDDLAAVLDLARRDPGGLRLALEADPLAPYMAGRTLDGMLCMGQHHPAPGDAAAKPCAKWGT